MGRVIKLLIGLALLPLLWATLQFAFTIFWMATGGPGWSWWKVVWFGTGFSLWLTLFVFMPRPTWLYVLGHELTHAVAIWLSGGKVHRFRITSAGGEVHTDKSSTFIALAPYIIPLFPAVTGALWLWAAWMWPHLKDYEPWFLLVWGIIWSFHISFTVTLLPTDQSDFESQGYLFSYVTILLGNLWIITALVWIWAGGYGYREGLWHYAQIAGHHYSAIGQILWKGMHWLFSLFKSPGT